MSKRRLAIGYSRVSSREQSLEGDSIESQKNTIVSYCDFKDITLDRVIREEGESGAIPLKDRTKGKVLVEEIRSGKYTDVVITRLDRAFRNVMDCLEMVEEWESLGIAVHVKDLGGQTIDTSTAMGRCFVTIVAAFGQLERDLISERTSEIMRLKKSKGEYCGGGIPYGYMLDDSGELLIENKEEMKVAQKAIHLKENQGHSYRETGKRLKRLGFSPRKGSEFHPQTVKRIIESAKETN